MDIERPFADNDFNNKGVWDILNGKVFPALEEAMRLNLHGLFADHSMTQEDFNEVGEQAKLLKAAVSFYIDGLRNFHASFALSLYGMGKETRMEAALTQGTKTGKGKRESDNPAGE